MRWTWGGEGGGEGPIHKYVCTKFEGKFLNGQDEYFRSHNAWTLKTVIDHSNE